MTHEFLRGELRVPSKLLEHAQGELGIAVLDLRALRIGAFGKEGDAIALDAEARAERAATFLHRQVGVVENRTAGMLQFRRAPAWPRQAVDFAAHLWTVPRCAQRDDVELGLVSHVRLEA